VDTQATEQKSSFDQKLQNVLTEKDAKIKEISDTLNKKLVFI